MMTPEHHDQADRMDERMHAAPLQPLLSYIEILRKAVDAVVEPTERALGVPAQAVYESAYALTREGGMDPMLVGSLVARELRAAREKAIGSDQEYLDQRLGSIERALGA